MHKIIRMLSKKTKLFDFVKQKFLRDGGRMIEIADDGIQECCCF